MIAASQCIVDDFAQTQLGATMQTSIVVNMNRAVRISPYNDVLAKTMQTDRLILHKIRPADRIPHVSESELQMIFEID